MPKKAQLVAEGRGQVVAMGTVVGTLTGSLQELRVDPDVVEEIHSALTDVAELLRDDRFGRTGAIEQTSFGARESGESLSFHHGRAHQVMTDTLAGITLDIAAFAITVRRAADEIMDSDVTAMQDLNKRMAATEDLIRLGRRSFGDAANNQSRNNVRDPFATGGR